MKKRTKEYYLVVIGAALGSMFGGLYEHFFKWSSPNASEYDMTVVYFIMFFLILLALMVILKKK